MTTDGAVTTVTIGQDSLSVTSPSFSLTATRASDTLTFDDYDISPTEGSVLTATQTAATFNAGLVPFNLGGTWTMQAGEIGGSTVLTCTLSVSATEIDGACTVQDPSPATTFFTFTTSKMSASTSAFGDFGGTWNNVWTWGGPDGGVALALGGLPPEELPRLRARLDESVDEAVRRAAPSLYDLEGDHAAAPQADPLRRALPDLPALTAAANVLGAPWEAAGVSVELGPVCNAAAARCVPLSAPRVDRKDALIRRGRALAWSLGNAARLRVPASSRVALLRSLQDKQTARSGTIALVFAASRGTLDEAELELLREQAHRAGARPPRTPRGAPGSMR